MPGINRDCQTFSDGPTNSLLCGFHYWQRGGVDFDRFCMSEELEATSRFGKLGKAIRSEDVL